MKGFLADTLLMTGALLALALILRRPVARWFGAQAAYALWALPALRLLLPPIVLPAWLAPEAAATAAPASVEVIEVGGETVAQGSAVAPPFDWSPIVVALWLGGVVAFLAWRVVSYRAMRARLLAEARPVGEFGAIRLVETPEVTAPVAFGVLDKVVALPPAFMALPDRRARDLALAHELAHHARHDLAANMAAQPLLALHWFNPLAWLAWRAMRRDQEAACDARVLSGRGREERAAYAGLIASVAGGPRLALAAPMACPVLGEKSVIHRLRSLSMPEPTAQRRRLGRALFASAALALPLTATLSYAAQEAPPAPAAPAAPTAPRAPDAPRVEKKVVVIRHNEGKDGAQPMHSRTVTRDGKTVTIVTDREIDDAELDRHLARIEAELPAPPAPPAPPVAGAAPTPPAPPAPPRIERRVIMAGPGAHAMTFTGPGTHAMAFSSGECKDAADKDDTTEFTTPDGQRHVIKVRVCGTRLAMQASERANEHALAAVRRARDSIASNRTMPADVRDEVLKELDEEILSMQKGG